MLIYNSVTVDRIDVTEELLSALIISPRLYHYHSVCTVLSCCNSVGPNSKAGVSDVTAECSTNEALFHESDTI